MTMLNEMSSMMLVVWGMMKPVMLAVRRMMNDEMMLQTLLSSGSALLLPQTVMTQVLLKPGLVAMTRKMKTKRTTKIIMRMSVMTTRISMMTMRMTPTSPRES